MYSVYLFDKMCNRNLTLWGNVLNRNTILLQIGIKWVNDLASKSIFVPTEKCKMAKIYKNLARLPPRTTSSRWQVDKEAFGLSRVQQFSHLCVARPYQISVNSIF